MIPIKAPFLPPHRLRQISEEFLKEHHPSGELPVPIERIVEFRLGLDIVPVPGLCDEFDVDAFITSDLTEIRVDKYIQEKRSNRYRFSLAHEVGHFIVHQDVFSQLQFSTIKEWKSTICSIPQDEYGWIEWQAYELGGLLLVPLIPLRDIFQDQVKKAEAAGLDLSAIDEDARKYVESAIAKHFEVSPDVIQRRMRREKMWA